MKILDKNPGDTWSGERIFETLKSSSIDFWEFDLRLNDRVGAKKQ